VKQEEESLKRSLLHADRQTLRREIEFVSLRKRFGGNEEVNGEKRK
jgi:hypothetical protein